MGICQDNQWVMRKIAAERLELIGLEFTQSEIQSTLTKEITELLEDEEIIVRTAAIVSLFRILYEKGAGVIEAQVMNKAMSKNLPVILDKVHEDEDSHVKLTREIGKIAYCLHLYYPDTYTVTSECIASYFAKAMAHSSDEIQVNAAFNMPAFSSIGLLDCSKIVLKVA
jgi:hypothetical protein